MIAPESFQKVVAAFADRIGKPLGPEAQAMYLTVLSDELTTDEFLAASRIVFKRHTFNTWPNAQEFIDAVKPVDDVNAKASNAWEAVRGACKAYMAEGDVINGVFVPDQRARLEKVKAACGDDSSAVEAFWLCSGTRLFGSWPDDETWLRKEYLGHYVSAAKGLNLRREAHHQLAAVTRRSSPSLSPVGESLADAAKMLTERAETLSDPIRAAECLSNASAIQKLIPESSPSAEQEAA